MSTNEQELLTTQLMEMAQASTEAEAFLSQLSAAFFPGGEPALRQLTWADRHDGARTRQADEHMSPEAKLRQAEARYRTLIEQIPAVTFMAVLGEGKNEIYVSPHIHAMLGFSQEEWLENPFLWYTQLHEGDRALWNQEFARGCHTGGPFKAECRFLARDGHVVWVHGEARLVKDDLGRPQFLQGIAFDITASKKAQEVLLNDAVSTAKVEEEMAIARRVQTSILPTIFNVRGLEIGATMIPAVDVGGDYYDVLPFPGGAWIAIGDVAGHGLNAGLVMLMVQSAMGAVLRATPNASPREVLATVNEVMYDNIRNRLMRDEHLTLTLLRYSEDGTVVHAGAHEDMLIARHATGKIESVPPTGVWLGARRDIRPMTTDDTFKLENGDALVLYTDGVTEAMSATREQYNIARLKDVITRTRAEHPDRMCEAIVGEVRAWMVEQEDDISIVAMRYTAP